MLAVVLNAGAITTAAAQIGIIGELAIADYLGVKLRPVTCALIAAVLTKLPVTARAAFSVTEAPCDPELGRRLETVGGATLRP